MLRRLDASSRGRYVITTFSGTRSIIDLDAMTYRRMPKDTSHDMEHDNQLRIINSIVNYPEVDSSFFLYHSAAFGGDKRWVQSSAVVKIQRV